MKGYEAVSKENWDKLVEIIAVLLEIDAGEVSTETASESVEQWDSLNHINICTAASQEFGVEITTEEMTTIRNVKDLAGILSSKGISFDQIGF